MDRKCLAVAFFHGHRQRAFMPMLGVCGPCLSFSFHLPLMWGPRRGIFLLHPCAFLRVLPPKNIPGARTVAFSFFFVWPLPFIFHELIHRGTSCQGGRGYRW